MFAIDQFTIKKLEETSTEGTFSIEPLPKGFGHTLGTSLRRILLSSIPGAAVTSIKIAGVQHEYTTVSGLSNDVLSLVLAMKELAVVSHSDTPVTLKLEKKGKKGAAVDVTAADIEKNPMVEVKNPDYVITTLADEQATIDAEITIEKGVGYSLPNEDVRQETGSIPVDAIFNPVRLVSLKVDNARVGQQTDLDALQLEIHTDGTITPSVALRQASEIFVTLGQHLLEMNSEIVEGDVVSEIGSTEITSSGVAVETAASALPVAEIEDMPTRVKNALLTAGYSDLRDFEGMTEEEIAEIKGLGDKSYSDLIELLSRNNIRLV